MTELKEILPIMNHIQGHLNEIEYVLEEHGIDIKRSEPKPKIERTRQEIKIERDRLLEEVRAVGKYSEQDQKMFLFGKRRGLEWVLGE